MSAPYRYCLQGGHSSCWQRLYRLRISSLRRIGLDAVQIISLCVGVFASIAFSGDAAQAKVNNAVRIHDYALTMPNVVKFDAAMRALEVAINSSPALKADARKMAQELGSSVFQRIERLKRHPKVLRFFTSKGLSIDDAALIPVIMGNGCLVGGASPLPQGLALSSAQRQFCKTNYVALHKLRSFSPIKSVSAGH